MKKNVYELIKFCTERQVYTKLKGNWKRKFFLFQKNWIFHCQPFFEIWNGKNKVFQTILKHFQKRHFLCWTEIFDFGTVFNKIEKSWIWELCEFRWLPLKQKKNLCGVHIWILNMNFLKVSKKSLFLLEDIYLFRKRDFFLDFRF